MTSFGLDPFMLSSDLHTLIVFGTLFRLSRQLTLHPKSLVSLFFRIMQFTKPLPCIPIQMTQLLALDAFPSPLHQHLTPVLRVAVMVSAVPQTQSKLVVVAGFLALVFVVFG